MPVQFSPFHSYDTGYPDKHIVMTGDQFEWALRFLEQSPAITFDFETSGLRWFRDSYSIGIGLAGWDKSTSQLQSFYVPYRHRTGERQWELDRIGGAIAGLLADESKMKVAHNLKFDMHFARQEGWQVRGPLYDTMIAAWLFDENRRIALKVRAQQDLGRFDADEWEKKVDAHVLQLARFNKIGVKEYRNRHGYSQVPIPLCGTYGCFDVEFTTQLFWLYERSGISSLYPRIWNTEMGLLEALCDMEEMGMPIDVDYLEALRSSLTGILESLELKIQQQLGRRVQLGSDDEVRKLLLGLGCRLTKRTKKKALSVDREVLESFSSHHPVIPLIMEWRDADKIVSTYTNSILSRLDNRNVLHADFQQVGTNTGRLSCREPNLQNQSSDNNARAIKHTGKSLEDGGWDPWSVRRAYINRGPGWVRQFWDYSQIELRVLAFYSRDPVMMDAYLKGEDIHARTSQEVFGTVEKAMRRMAKIINFGLSYCMTDIGFARQAKIPQDQASQYLQKFFERYAGVASFRQVFWQQVRSQKSSFQNIFGRPRRVPGIVSPDKWERGSSERQAIATLIQGTAAELTKESIVRVHKFFKEEKLPAYLVSTVHDEIQFDCHTDVLEQTARGVKSRMEYFPEFNPVPIIVDGDYTTTSWADKKGLPI